MDDVHLFSGSSSSGYTCMHARVHMIHIGIFEASHKFY